MRSYNYNCICCIVRYVYCLPHADNPFKASLLPAIFLLCLGGSKLSNNRKNANTIDNILRKPLDGGEPLGCAGLPLYTLALFMLFTFWVVMKIYRTVFTANRAAAFSGQSTFSRQSHVIENPSSGDATEDIIFDLQNPRKSGDQLSSVQTIHVQDNKDSFGKFFKATSESAEWIFLATNLGLEMLSAACDQVPPQAHYALFVMLLAIAAVIISIWELTAYQIVHSGDGECSGSFIIHLLVRYVYCLRHADNPFKASLLPAIFLLCLGGSKLSNNRRNANTTDNILRKPLDGNSSTSTSTITSTSRSSPLFQAQRGLLRSRWRAPQMRWTTTLHARLVHAVYLLGGHERATPDSVLELMDVKDLTLAHVRSHLQIYWTVFTANRAAAFSGHSTFSSNLFEKQFINETCAIQHSFMTIV
ncbi:unnamed protein product [Prunus brigantina]